MLLSKGEKGFRVGLLKDGSVIVGLTAGGMDTQRPKTAFIFFTWSHHRSCSLHTVAVMLGLPLSHLKRNVRLLCPCASRVAILAIYPELSYSPLSRCEMFGRPSA
jgi:hypothetical protein